jgi:hypothetical protein
MALTKATTQSQQQRGRGRPRSDTCRIECSVPRTVLQLLIQREREGHGYRTRIAARILCTWASRETGQNISNSSKFGAIQ